MPTNGRHGGQETCFTGPIFAMGAVGGIALDVVTLYFSGFSSSAQSGWLVLGVVVRAAAFMALAGVLACLFSTGNYRTAFAIGVAAPSIIVNLGASVQVQKPREAPAVTIPSIPAPTTGPSGYLRGRDVLLAAISVPLAEAQPRTSETTKPTAGASIGQVRVLIVGIKPSSDATLAILDKKSGATLAVTKVPSEEFDFSFAPGQYLLALRGAESTADPVPVKIEGGHRISVRIMARANEGASTEKSGLSEFLKGASQRFEHVSDVKQQSGMSK